APAREIPNLAKIAWDELVQHFGAANSWEANAARFEWIDRSPEQVLDATRTPVEEHLLSKKRSLTFRLQWLWALEASGRLGAQNAGLGGNAWTETLVSLLHDPESNIRRETIRALGSADFKDFAGRELLPYFAELCADDADIAVRTAAIRILAHNQRFAGIGPVLMRFASRVAPPVGATPSERFERSLLRDALEFRRFELKSLLASGKASLPVEARSLVALALAPDEGAPLLADLIPELKRPLASDEIGLLMTQQTSAKVARAMEQVLADSQQQREVLRALATDQTLPEPARESNAFHEQLTQAARQWLQREPAEANRAIVVKLAKNLGIRALAPEIVAYLESPDRKPGEQIEAIKALRALRSGGVALFRKLALGGNEEVRREAVLGIAGADGADVVTVLVTLWPRLSPPLRKLALERASASPQHAAALVAAARDGFLPADDFDVAILDRLARHLGENDPALRQVMSGMKNALQPVLRLHGRPDDSAETNIDLRGPFTVEAWVRLDPDIDNNDNLLGRKGGADINFYDARLRVYGGADVRDVVIAKTPVKPLTWTHVAVSRDASGNIRLYINGDLDAASMAPFTGPLTGLNIGETNPGHGCAAAYSEFR
ncbi:MAG TPA: LamG-like jellyroll fold domain-containing protein, partial [bacterium]|nr:LamG-like jellyroll fold domain-containing protein [bacterium]